MPVSNTNELIPFVNQLEAKLNDLSTSMSSWQQNKGAILAAVPQVAINKTNAITAIVKAEDALAELNTATFGVVAAKGQKLKKLLEDLKAQVVEIAENASGTGVESYIKDEVNNAIAEVDSVVDDGLKLDFRLRRIQEMAQDSLDFINRDIVMPYKLELTHNVTETVIQVPAEEGIIFLDGLVTVLDENGEKGFLTSSNRLLLGSIDVTGQIILDEAPKQPVRLYFPVQMKFKDVPDDFLYFLLETVVSKTSPLMEMLQRFEKMLTGVLTDIEAMKGVEWTADFSIMRNQKEIVTESITPKGLMVTVQDGMAHATFSYNEHPLLSHFILEKWDEDANDWKPYDGDHGIIAK
ncbi:hypothetical protein SAMN02799624_05417 [Paenibacillus sp. UNC496MF]|uniref:hypothetical protein n=1 Tax=Paenibacillus sp. UNC496MF TaxID=1502753 RepID=UPI0008DFCE1D|nr:hypothetical protein [Paenibacillus sp. UNC496MF]SFJ65794.1 hypothetical protein SAMN02799624_05417 [Paenibacillus sp. UNC496MF]